MCHVCSVSVCVMVEHSLMLDYGWPFELLLMLIFVPVKTIKLSSNGVQVRKNGTALSSD